MVIQGETSVGLNDVDNASVHMSDSTSENTTELTPDSTPVVIQNETTVDLSDADNASVDLSDAEIS